MSFYFPQKRFEQYIDFTFRDPMLLSVKGNLTMSLLYLIPLVTRTIFISYTPCKKLLILFTKSSKILDFSNDWLHMIHQNTILNPTLAPTLETSKLIFCYRLFIVAIPSSSLTFFAVPSS